MYRRVDIAAHSPLTVAHVVDGKGVGGGDLQGITKRNVAGMVVCR
jgi:hypothetical protein